MNKESSAWRPLALSLVILGTLSRLLPHPPNMTAVGAASLFSGARLRRWQAYLVPLACMLLTDPVLGVIYGFRPFSRVTPFVYASFLVNVWLGRRVAGTTRPARIGLYACLGTLQFFLVSNFGVWAMGGGHAYPHTAAGLLACYVAALPFFGRMLVADVGYAAVLFGLHAWLGRRVFTAERVATAAAE
jgi:hypothetical protein